jgi:hypothetical protein
MAKLQSRLQIQAFDVFLYTPYPAGGHFPRSQYHTIQLWVWVPHGYSESSETFWKPVPIGYVCPGPGPLRERHLMITDGGEPTWITLATRARRYKAVLPPSTALCGSS